MNKHPTPDELQSMLETLFKQARDVNDPITSLCLDLIRASNIRRKAQEIEDEKMRQLILAFVGQGVPRR